MDCWISDKGPAERILIELQGGIKFDRVSNQFTIKSEGQYKKASTQLIQDIISATIQKLPKEIRLINDAVKAGIFTDVEGHKVRLIRYVERSRPHNVHTVVAIMKTLLTTYQASGPRLRTITTTARIDGTATSSGVAMPTVSGVTFYAA